LNKQHKQQYDQYIKDWFAGKVTGNRGPGQVSSHIKRYLNSTYNSCEICGTSKLWNNKELKFIVDHIDGNSDDSSPKNLRLICPNCDSQLPTFKGKNKGRGRFSRRERYKQGKSS
jgi:hypothetical protein